VICAIARCDFKASCMLVTVIPGAEVDDDKQTDQCEVPRVNDLWGRIGRILAVAW
jgi:hypothetical protein